MKALHFFASAVAIAMLSACSSSDEPAADASATGGETGYLAVNLVNANNGGRADDPTYDYVNGDATENSIKTCRLYFFGPTGAAFPVNATTTGGANNHNWITLSVVSGTDQDDHGNVEKIYSSTLILKSSEDTAFPSSVMAVANFDATVLGDDDLSLDQLKAKVETIKIGATDNTFYSAGFPMASSVYSNGEAIVYATPIGDKIATSEANAVANPVDIYIERSVARVDLSKAEDADATDWTFNLVDDAKNFKVNITGWAVVNNPQKSYVVKNLDNAWSAQATAPFTGWNSAELYRSFWAKMPTDYGTLNRVNYNGINNPTGLNTIKYYTTENTNNWVATGTAEDVNTQIILAGVLQKADGSGVNIYRYMGQTYAEARTTQESKSSVLAAIANTFKGKYFIKTGDEYTTIGPEQLNLVSAHGLSYPDLLDYHVVAQINDSNLEIYDESHTKADVENVNADLAKYPAEIAIDGKVYYFADIKHLGDKIGVVRNHVYEIEVESFTGYGTPVFDPEKEIIPTNVVDAETYVAARIKVHSWRIVNNKYNFGN